MPRNSSGTYSLVSGNPVVTGTIITSSWANTTLPDMGTELTDSLSRTAKGGMLAALKHVNGSNTAPSQSYSNDAQSGLYLNAAGDVRMATTQVDQMKWTTDGATALGPLLSTAGNVNLKTTTALADAAATLTAAQLIGGEFTITPTVARIQTTDTAVNIIAALTDCVDGSNFDFAVVNLDAFDVTIAAGAGVTLVGNMVINEGSATFNVARLSATTASVTRLDSASSAGDASKANLSGADFTGQVNSTAGNVNLKSNTALSDAAATLTAAQLIGGEFTITPTVARIQTTDTATAIIAALGGSVDNSNFDFTMINLDAFDVTIAAGTGVTLVGNMVVNDGSATFRVRRLTSSTVSVTRLETGASRQIMIVRDEKPNATSGGTFNNGAWNTRDLNDVTFNTIAGASLGASDNRITLPAGTYRIQASAPAYRPSSHQIKLANITDTTDAIIGTSEQMINTGTSQSRSFIDDVLILSSEKVFEIQHRNDSNQATNGFGFSADFSVVEVYTMIMIEKIG